MSFLVGRQMNLLLLFALNALWWIPASWEDVLPEYRKLNKNK